MDYLNVYTLTVIFIRIQNLCDLYSLKGFHITPLSLRLIAAVNSSQLVHSTVQNTDPLAQSSP